MGESGNITAQVRDRINTPDTDADRDTVVAVDCDGSVVGSGHLRPALPDEIRCFTRTHPDHRGRGVGTALQRHLIARAIGLAAGLTPEHPTLTTTSWPQDAGSEVLLAHVGYAPARYYVTMVRDLAEPDEYAVPAPAGLTIRTFAAGDEDAIFRAYAESFAEHPGHEHPDPAIWWRERRDADAAGYDPTLWLVALDADELVGFAIAKVQRDSAGGEYGYIGDLGVRPGWRGHGLATTLLGHSFTVQRDRGLPYVALDVDTENTTGAVRLYASVGIAPRPSFTIWSRALTPV